MKRIVLIVLTAVFVMEVVSASGATDRSQKSLKHFEFLPAVDYRFGETEYVLDAYGFDSLGRTIYVKSQLEFPLDGFSVGGALRYTVDPQNPMPWVIRVGVSTNLTEPKGIMRDRDWTNYWSDVYLPAVIEVSNTESDVTMNSVSLEAEVSKVIATNDKTEFRLFGGFRYQWFDQEVIGFKGYQYNPRGDTMVTFDVPGLRGIDYTVSFYIPNAGLGAAMSLGEKASIAAHGAYALVIAKDRDDHLLRKKLSTASVTGNGFIGGADVTIEMSRGRATPVYLTLSGEFVYLSASGTQTQMYYGDDPSYPGDETGESQPGIPHVIHSTQGRVGMEIGMRF